MIYLIKFTACLTLLLVFYHLGLEKEKMHRFNRFFLLGGLFFSLIIPVLEIYTFNGFSDTTYSILETSTLEYGVSTESTQLGFWSWAESHQYVFVSLYLLITTLLLIRFSRVVIGFMNRINKHPKVKYKSAQVVLLNEEVQPHTFMNYIFMNRDEYDGLQLENELLSHELAHVRHMHTIDNLVIELAHTLLWFNPLFIFLKKAIRLNHEFQADEAALSEHTDVAKYQQLLLSKAQPDLSYELASNINYSLTKKRFQMMTTNKSAMMIALKKAAILPLFMGLTFLFSSNISAQSSTTSDKVSAYNLLATKVIKDGVATMSQADLIKLKTLYSEMSESQRKAAVQIPASKLNPEHSGKEYLHKDGDTGHNERKHEGHDGDGEHEKDGHVKDSKEHIKKEGNGHDQDIKEHNVKEDKEMWEREKTEKVKYAKEMGEVREMKKGEDEMAQFMAT